MTVSDSRIVKYLIFSDTHLEPRFEPDKCRLLLEAINDADRVIINGDFWEGYLHSFDAIVKSPWATELFPALKKKKAIYLFGNHDGERHSDERVNLFSATQGQQYAFESGEKTIIVEHGDRVYPMLDSKIGLLLPGWTVNVLQGVEEMALRIFGHRFSNIFYRPMNEKIKKGDLVSKLDKDTYLITGHTHFAEVDHDSRYANSGFNKYGRISYITVEDGDIQLHQKRYKE